MSKERLFKIVSFRDAEFKGQCADTRKYYDNHSFLVNLISISLVGLLIIGVLYLKSK